MGKVHYTAHANVTAGVFRVTVVVATAGWK